jgi:hypothetical protein
MSKAGAPIPCRNVQTPIDPIHPLHPRSRDLGLYSFRFPDWTWRSPDIPADDHYASVREVTEVAGEFDTCVRTIVSAEEAARLQHATDLLMDEIADLLRAENREDGTASAHVQGCRTRGKPRASD